MSAKPPKQTSAPERQTIHARLELAAGMVSSTTELSAERAAEILRERARALARVPTEPLEHEGGLELAVFRLGRERYGIEARYVREVMRLVDCTPVPGLPEFFFGVTNLRGEILAVVDLARLLRIEREGLTDLSRLLVVGEREPEFGFLADEIHEVVELAEGALHPPTTALGDARHGYVRGITADALIVLEGAALLADPRLFFDEGEEGLPAAARGPR